MNQEETYDTIAHLDTSIGGKHIIIDTIYKRDTLVIEKHTFDKEIQVIEKLLDRPDFGKSAVSICVLLYVCFSIWKKWSCKKEN